jgi:hypothetical protein
MEMASSQSSNDLRASICSHRPSYDAATSSQPKSTHEVGQNIGLGRNAYIRTMTYTPQNKSTTINLVDIYTHNNPGCTVGPYLLLIVVIFAILFGYPAAYYCYWLVSRDVDQHFFSKTEGISRIRGDPKLRNDNRGRPFS